MYYEETIINGVRHWRGRPDGKWCKLTAGETTKRLVGARAAEQVEARQQSGAAPVQQAQLEMPPFDDMWDTLGYDNSYKCIGFSVYEAIRRHFKQVR